MNSQYSGSLVSDDYSENSIESFAEDDNRITTVTEERDESSSEICSGKELDPWTTLINDAASKVQDKYDDILQRFSWRVTTKANQKTLPVFQKELGNVYMDNLAWSCSGLAILNSV